MRLATVIFILLMTCQVQAAKNCEREYGAMAKVRKDGNFHVGGLVVMRQNSEQGNRKTGTIISAKGNKAKVRWSSGGQAEWPLSLLAPETEHAANIKPGDRVCGNRKSTTGNWVFGTVLHTFSGKHLSIQWDRDKDPNNSWKVKDVSKKIPRYKGFEKGVRVRSKEGTSLGNWYAGTVEEVYEGGKLGVIIDGFENDGLKRWHSSEMAKKIERWGRLYPGQRVVTKQGNLSNNRRLLGTVTEVYEGGLIAVQFDGYDKPDLSWERDSVGVKVSFHKGMKPGMRIMSKPGKSESGEVFMGRVNEVFDNNQITTIWDGSSGVSHWSQDTVVRNIPPPKGYSVGQNALTPDGQRSQITEFFEQGHVSIVMQNTGTIRNDLKLQDLLTQPPPVPSFWQATRELWRLLPTHTRK